MLPRLLPPAVLATAVATALAGCMSDANPVRDQLNAVGIGPKAVTAPDFVAGSRPATLDYVPVGSSAPPRPRAKTAGEVKALEAELEAARGRNAARGGVRAASGTATASGTAAPAKKKPSPSRDTTAPAPENP
jgi:hypothetical protein